MAEVYTTKEMRDQYGAFFGATSLLSLDGKRIPQVLWPLIPYAAFWGVEDDRLREALVSKAPKQVKANFKAVIREYEPQLLKWLAGVESYDKKPSLEYCAFAVMFMAADFIMPADLN